MLYAYKNSAYKLGFMGKGGRGKCINAQQFLCPGREEYIQFEKNFEDRDYIRT